MVYILLGLTLGCDIIDFLFPFFFIGESIISKFFFLRIISDFLDFNNFNLFFFSEFSSYKLFFILYFELFNLFDEI